MTSPRSVTVVLFIIFCPSVPSSSMSIVPPTAGFVGSENRRRQSRLLPVKLAVVTQEEAFRRGGSQHPSAGRWKVVTPPATLFVSSSRPVRHETSPRLNPVNEVPEGIP